METGQYVDRIAGDINLATLVKMEGVNIEAIFAAMLIAWNPEDASKILANFGLTEEQVRERVQDFLYKRSATNSLRMPSTSPKSSGRSIAAGGAIDDVERVITNQNSDYELNDLANGLAALSDAPDEIRKHLMKALEEGLGTDDAARAVFTYLRQQMGLLADEGGKDHLPRPRGAPGHDRSPSKSTSRPGSSSRRKDQMPDGRHKKVKRARAEMILMSMTMAMEGEVGPEYVEALLAEWKQDTSGRHLDRAAAGACWSSMDELANTPPPSSRSGAGMTQRQIDMSEMRRRLQLQDLELARLAGGIDGKIGQDRPDQARFPPENPPHPLEPRVHPVRRGGRSRVHRRLLSRRLGLLPDLRHPLQPETLSAQDNCWLFGRRGPKYCPSSASWSRAHSY